MCGRRVCVYWVVIAMVYTQTISVHPALTALVVSTQPHHSPWTDSYFTPVACFLVSKEAYFIEISRYLNIPLTFT